MRKLGYGAMHGIPMMALSPMRHDITSVGVGHNPVDVHSYEPPWKALCDFALHSDLDRLHPGAPPYQNIVNQVILSLRFSFSLGMSIKTKEQSSITVL